VRSRFPALEIPGSEISCGALRRVSFCLYHVVFFCKSNTVPVTLPSVCGLISEVNINTM
jgi:hypothetical protein